MENIPESVQQTADELNGILSSFISRHPASLKYRTTEDGYSIFTIKYGKYRESEIKRVKEFINNTDYDELLSIEGIPVTCVKVNDFIMIFKGKKSEVENFILNSNIEDERLQEKISEKVKAINYSQYNNDLNNLYTKINDKILWMINHYSQFNQTTIKDFGFSFNKINNDISQVSLNIEKFNSYRDIKLKNEIKLITPPSIPQLNPYPPADYSPPAATIDAGPILPNFSSIWIPSQETTINVNYKTYMSDIYDIISKIIMIKKNHSKVESILKNNNYKTVNDRWFFNIIKSSDTQLIIEYNTKVFEEKIAFSIDDFNLRHLRWYEIEEYFNLSEPGTNAPVAVGDVAVGDDAVEVQMPDYQVFKLNPRFREDGIILPREIPERFDNIMDYISSEIFIPVSFGERYNKNTIYVTPTRYGPFPRMYYCISYEEAKEIINGSGAKWRLFELADDITPETFVDRRDLIGYTTGIGIAAINPKFKFDHIHTYLSYSGK